MTDKKILEKAIQKAIDGGCKVASVWLEELEDATEDWILEPGQSEWYFIWDHDFAKALWGQEKTMYDPTGEYYAKGWQYHLQQMVIANNPIQYLGEHSDD